MTAVERLLAHPEIPHGRIRVAFTPDEEIGRGTLHFDVAGFGARYAYTMDGGDRGDLECESFSADAMTVTFVGFNTHPGYAKGRMVNAIKAAATFIDLLPQGHAVAGDHRRLRGIRAPVHAAGRCGPHHPCDSLSATLSPRRFERRKHCWPRSRSRRPPPGQACASRRAIEEQYRNMREVLDRHPDVVEHAREAMRRAGVIDPRTANPRRHRRLEAVVHGPADAQHLRRRAQLPLAARMGLGSGHGQGGRRDHRAGARLVGEAS